MADWELIQWPKGLTHLAADVGKQGQWKTKCEAGISLKSCAPLLQSGDQPQPEFYIADGGGVPGQESWH